MLQDMDKFVEIGSSWYVVSMFWIKKWEAYVGFESEITGEKPGKMDNTDIIQPYCSSTKDPSQVVSTILEEWSPNYSGTDIQLKRNIKEGEDYMLVD